MIIILNYINFDYGMNVEDAEDAALLVRVEYPTRVEECEVCVCLSGKDKKLLKRIEKDFDMKLAAPICKQDSFIVTYSFNIEYFGTVEKRLKSLLQLMRRHREKVTKVKLRELNRQTILIQQVLEELATFES